MSTGATPHVYPKLLEIAHHVRNSGKRRFGMMAIFERLRWMSNFETEGDIYKLNNNYRSLYARKIMAENADLADFFQIREREVE
jgi:hypothetical protein